MLQCLGNESTVRYAIWTWGLECWAVVELGTCCILVSLPVGRNVRWAV